MRHVKPTMSIVSLHKRFVKPVTRSRDGYESVTTERTDLRYRVTYPNIRILSANQLTPFFLQGNAVSVYPV